MREDAWIPATKSNVFALAKTTTDLPWQLVKRTSQPPNINPTGLWSIRTCVGSHDHALESRTVLTESIVLSLSVNSASPWIVQGYAYLRLHATPTERIVGRVDGDFLMLQGTDIATGQQSFVYSCIIHAGGMRNGFWTCVMSGTDGATGYFVGERLLQRLVPRVLGFVDGTATIPLQALAAVSFTGNQSSATRLSAYRRICSSILTAAQTAPLPLMVHILASHGTQLFKPSPALFMLAANQPILLALLRLGLYDASSPSTPLVDPRTGKPLYDKVSATMLVVLSFRTLLMMNVLLSLAV